MPIPALVKRRPVARAPCCQTKTAHDMWAVSDSTREARPHTSAK